MMIFLGLIGIVIFVYTVITVSTLSTYGWYLSPGRSKMYLDQLRDKNGRHWVSGLSGDTICSLDMPAIYPVPFPSILFKYTVMNVGVIFRFSPLHYEVTRILKEGKI